MAKPEKLLRRHFIGKASQQAVFQKKLLAGGGAWATVGSLGVWERGGPWTTVRPLAPSLYRTCFLFNFFGHFWYILTNVDDSYIHTE